MIPFGNKMEKSLSIKEPRYMLIGMDEIKAQIRVSKRKVEKAGQLL